MGISKVDSLAELLETSNEALVRACATGAAAYLIVPSHLWALQRKLQLRHVVPMGVDVLTHDQLVERLWELNGNGLPLVTTQERQVLLRPLITQVGLFDSSPSPAFVSQLASFVEEAICPGLVPSEPLTQSQSRVMELVSLYESKLAHEGLVEPAQAESMLVHDGACAGLHLVFESPDLRSAHVRRFIAGIEGMARVSVIEQRLAVGAQCPNAQDELEHVRHQLFTGMGGVVATGQVRVGLAHGAHVADNVTVGLMQGLHADGVDYARMLVCCARTSDAYPGLLDALAHAGIPFATQLDVPCARTGLGAAFCQLGQLDTAADEDASFAALVDLAMSPYSGIGRQDAQALQMRWRERAQSTSDARMLDVRDGFDQGNATASQVRERLEPLRALIDATRPERVRMLFENARAAHVGADVLLDDRLAADALLDYLDVCERFSCQPDVREMANLPVTVGRSFGEEESGAKIVDTGALGIMHEQAIVMCGLDAAHYPMAAQAGPFDELMTRLGIERADTIARDQRLMLLNAIELCEDAFAFTRATHDAAGDESCQSALFEELVGVYRSEQEDGEGLPVQAVPAALRPWLYALSEADALFGDELGAGACREVARGALERPGAAGSLAHDLKGNAQPFSPTALEDYYRCPYRWFTCRRVGYNGMDTKFDAAAQGNLVHAVMERFYRQLKQAGYDRVTPGNLDHALEIASVAFDAQVGHDRARERRGLYLHTQLDELLCEELRADVLSLVERDASFLPGFVPTHFELELGRSSGVPLEYAGVPVRGKVDRIDVDQDGNAVVMDYKLSGLSTGYGLAANAALPQRIQTDIYATLVERHFAALGQPVRVVGSVYRSYAHNMLRGVYSQGIAWGDDECVRADLDALPRPGSDEDYAAYLQRVEREVEDCVSRLHAGHIEPAPLSADVCEYCKARLFCPVGGA